MTHIKHILSEIKEWKKSNRWQHILRKYGKIHSADPDLWKNPDVVNQVGFAYSQLKQFEEALEYYHQFRALSPKDPLAHYSIGYVHYAQGLHLRSNAYFQQALPHLNKALDLRQAFIPCWYVLGNCHRRLNHVQESITAYQTVQSQYEALTDDFHQKFYRKHLVKASFGLAKVLLKARRFDDALQSAELSQSHDNRQYLKPVYHQYLRGEIYLALGELDSARQHFHQALQHEPRKEWIHDRLGRVACDQQNYAEADDHFRQALQCRRQGYIYVDRGINYLQAEQYSRALEAFETALPRSKKSQHKIFLLMARTHFAAENIQDALRFYKKAIERKQTLYQSDYPLALWELGLVLQAAGEKEQAIPYMERVEQHYSWTPRTNLSASQCFSGGAIYV